MELGGHTGRWQPPGKAPGKAQSSCASFWLGSSNLCYVVQSLCWAGLLERSPWHCWAQGSWLRALVWFYPQSQQMYGWFIMAISGVHLRPNTNLPFFSSTQFYAGAKSSRISGISLIKKGDPVALRLLGSFRKEVWWMTIWEYLILLLKMSTSQWVGVFCLFFLFNFCFIFTVLFSFGGGCKDEGWTQRNREMSGIGVDYAKLNKNQKSKKNGYDSFVVCCDGCRL